MAVVAAVGFCTYGPHILMVGHAAQDFGKKSGASGAAGLIDRPETPADHRPDNRSIIGARNVIREYANIHRGLNEESHTTVGDDNFFMGFSHIAHDCHVGSRIIIANGALLGGHVCVDDRTFISGNVVVHQFCRIGRLAMIGGSTKVTNDIPPFTIANGIPAQVRGLNVIGLRRADVPGAVRQELKNLLREIDREGHQRGDCLPPAAQGTPGGQRCP